MKTQHEHHYELGKSKTIKICKCGRFQHVIKNQDNVIIEQRKDDKMETKPKNIIYFSQICNPNRFGKRGLI